METTSYVSCYGNFHIPSPSINGQKFRIVDIGGNMQNDRVNIISNSPSPGSGHTNYVEGQIIKEYNANWLSTELMYIGNGLDGNCFCMDCSFTN